ncbi:MAG: hypothetical protein IT305_08635 [Chloroflexi bacterium]|nr:hypothetical protein [Chloroflexota bacterium]
MRQKFMRLARGAAILIVVVGAMAPAIGYAGNKDDDNKRKNNNSEQSRSQKEDHETQGQVLDINTLKNPPELKIANTDGVMTVHLLTTDLVEKNGVRLGDHITVIGEKISEIEFDAQELSVDAHLGDAISSSTSNENDNKNNDNDDD